jgi:hypothetical protein
MSTSNGTFGFVCPALAIGFWGGKIENTNSLQIQMKNRINVHVVLRLAAVTY